MGENMNQRAKNARPGAMRYLAVAALGTALASGIVACKKDDAATAAGQTAAGEATTAPPPVAVSSAVAAMGTGQLREAAQKALAETRMYAPAGDNAMEYYLALRDKSANDPGVVSALTDLQPYAVMATEQAIARKDFAESKRLYALLEKTDNAAPALPRLMNSITEGEKAAATAAVNAPVLTAAEKAKEAELDKKRLEEQKKLQEQAAKELAAKQAADRLRAEQQSATSVAAARAAADKAAADKAAADKAAADRAAADRAAAQRQTAAQPATPSRPASGSSDLVPVSTPSPRYPPEAKRARQAGTVQVEFTVDADGSVSNARVVSAEPSRVFDREALNAVRRWKFKPVSSPQTTRRTINFQP